MSPRQFDSEAGVLPDGVSVRLAPVPTLVPAAAAAGLAADELNRLASLPAGQRARFAGARLLLRAAVAERLGCAPAAVRFEQRCLRCGGPHGQVLVPGTGLAVSVTRAGPLLAVAVSSVGPVGVDVEDAAAVRRADLARVLPDPAPARAWVRLEAALKAAGTGLRTDPGSVRVDGGTALIPVAGRTVLVELIDLDLPDAPAGAVGALALSRPPGPGSGAGPGAAPGGPARR